MVAQLREKVAFCATILYIVATMANSKSAQKAYEASERKRVFNVRRVRAMRGAVKSILTLKDKKEAEGKISEVYKAIDKAVKSGIIKKNTASRKKSMIARAIAKLS